VAQQFATNQAFLTMKQMGKAKPFGAYFTTKLEGVNSKLVCALSAGNTCSDDPNCPRNLPNCQEP
jgi:hypothetical protein